MSYTMRPKRGGNGWEYDIRFVWPEGGRFRERANAPVASKSGAARWVEARERSLLAGGKAAYEAAKTPPPKTATLAEFWPRVVTDHYKANRKKASTIDAADSIYRNHLAPALGPKPLDKIAPADVAAIKGALAEKGAKTVNNVLSVLSRALKCAVDWGVIAGMPCKVGHLKVSQREMEFYELDEYRRLVDATWDPASRVLVLLAGSAGLRRGEIVALRWSDVDLVRRQVRIDTAFWRRVEDTPKGGRTRVVPLTEELVIALTALKRGRTVVALEDDDGFVLPGLTPRRVRNWLARAERRAGLIAGTAREVREEGSAIHKLRHTFCSHLAIAGAPAKAIQELAGHADLATTQRYMHLSPGNRSDAINALSKFYGGAEKTRRAVG